MLPDFSPLGVVVVGDVMLDRYLSGRVERISPEAPVPVLRYEREEDRLGGAGNVGLNLVALGARTALAGVTGADDNADRLGQALRENGIGTSALVRDARRPTTVKTRVIAQNQQLLRVDRESTENLTGEVEEALLGELALLLRPGAPNLVLLQDYNKGVLTPTVIERTLALSHEAGIAVAVDPKAANFWLYRGVDLFKPNLREIQQQCDFPVRPDVSSLDRAAGEIFDRLGCRNVMTTLSEHGIYYHDGTRSGIEPTQARRIADVSGAGDTVISVAACGLAAGMSLQEVAHLANLAGAQVIAKPGVVAVDAAELRAEWGRGA